jgi:hypothetical protein
LFVLGAAYGELLWVKDLARVVQHGAGADEGLIYGVALGAEVIKKGVGGL